MIPSASLHPRPPRHGHRFHKAGSPCLSCPEPCRGLAHPCDRLPRPWLLWIAHPRVLRHRVRAFFRAMSPHGRRASLWLVSPAMEMITLHRMLRESVLAALLLDPEGTVRAAALCQNDCDTFGCLHLLADPQAPPDADALLAAARVFAQASQQIFPILSMAIPRHWHSARRLALALEFAEQDARRFRLGAWLRGRRREVDLVIYARPAFWE